VTRPIYLPGGSPDAELEEIVNVMVFPSTDSVTTSGNPGAPSEPCTIAEYPFGFGTMCISAPTISPDFSLSLKVLNIPVTTPSEVTAERGKNVIKAIIRIIGIINTFISNQHQSACSVRFLYLHVLVIFFIFKQNNTSM